jgi:AcrR family transcriptional regulator
MGEDAGANFNELRRRLREHLEDDHHPKGLRERKKDLMRERISNTATMMFLERGFDEVRVSDVATACDVSEKTVYNYFPTKESLLLDRGDELERQVIAAFGPETVHPSPVDAMLAILTEDLDEYVRHASFANDTDRALIVRFNDLIERTPSLKAFRVEMMEGLTRVAATALASRAGVDPNDPEPQVAADALLSLWRVYYRALIKYADSPLSAAEVRGAVVNDVRRAARLIDTGLWSFTTVVEGARGRQQFQAAADASDAARKQVMLALKEARRAWHELKTEFEATARGEVAASRRSRQSLHAEAREFKREAQRQRQAFKNEIKDAVKRNTKSK